LSTEVLFWGNPHRFVFFSFSVVVSGGSIVAYGHTGNRVVAAAVHLVLYGDVNYGNINDSNNGGSWQNHEPPFRLPFRLPLYSIIVIYIVIIMGVYGTTRNNHYVYYFHSHYICSMVIILVEQGGAIIGHYINSYSYYIMYHVCKYSK
jgi:hypothetical protein